MRLFGLPERGTVPAAPPAGTFPIRHDLVLATARCWIVLAAAFFAWDLWRTTRVGLTDGIDRPLGWDFINYWSGASLAWRGAAARVYDWNAFHAFQQALAGGPIDFFHYSYPPILLILTAPLALLSYAPALAAWLLAGWYAFYRALRLALPRGALLLSLATPAMFVNAIGGQNGAWTAALLGGALSLLDRRPALAGVLFGLMSYKPHLGLLVPLALLAGRRWMAMATAAATCGILLAISLALYGPDVWSDYLRNVAILRETVLESGSGVWHRFVSVFTAVRIAGADVALAYAVQAAVALAVALVMMLAWWRRAPARVRNALLVVATMLATPYIQDYDLVVGAFVAAWLVAQGRKTRFEAQALWASALILLMPFVSALLARQTGLLWAPLFALPAFLVAARMAFASRFSAEEPGPARPPALPAARAIVRR